ncbi:MAG: putative glycoside hydrolase [Ruminococcus sp.]|nr:putative glycoside hydrolase [Ruminococcus sp.]
MKRKNKGRKIYKTKEKNYYGKSPAGKFMSGLLTVLLIGGIGFIGYSVAEPIINYTQHKGDEPSESTKAEENTSGDVTEGATDPSSGEKINAELFTAAHLRASDLTDMKSLQSALNSVPQGEGIEYVEVPLKVKGGKVYYASSCAEAKMSGAIQSSLTLGDINSAIKESGYKPAASVSVFCDNILPVSYPDTGFKTVDDGSQWLDNDPANGGKPWVSPFSSSALSYVSDIVSEVSAAGFDRVVCSDIMFPYFRESDLELLDEKLGKTERFMALTSAANMLYDKAVTNGASMYIEVSAADMLRGNGDVLKPMLLSANTVVVNIDVEELKGGITNGQMLYEFEGTPDEIADKCLKFVKDDLADFNVIVRLSGEGRTAQELLNASKVISSYGYSSFVIG